MGHFDRIDARRIQRANDLAHVLDPILMADRMHAGTQGDLGSKGSRAAHAQPQAMRAHGEILSSGPGRATRVHECRATSHAVLALNDVLKAFLSLFRQAPDIA